MQLKPNSWHDYNQTDAPRLSQSFVSEQSRHQRSRVRLRSHHTFVQIFISLSSLLYWMPNIRQYMHFLFWCNLLSAQVNSQVYSQPLTDCTYNTVWKCRKYYTTMFSKLLGLCATNCGIALKCCLQIALSEIYILLTSEPWHLILCMWCNLIEGRGNVTILFSIFDSALSIFIASLALSLERKEKKNSDKQQPGQSFSSLAQKGNTAIGNTKKEFHTKAAITLKDTHLTWL